MVENVQCPVCTLFLHAGMNLSDHLETHPKEQVIKALVQMTIGSVGINFLTNCELTAADKKPPEVEATGSTASKKETAANNKVNTLTVSGSSSVSAAVAAAAAAVAASAPASNTKSTPPKTIPSTVNNLTFPANFSAQAKTGSIKQYKTEDAAILAGTSTNSSLTGGGEKGAFNQQASNQTQPYQRGTRNVVVDTNETKLPGAPSTYGGVPPYRYSQSPVHTASGSQLNIPQLPNGSQQQPQQQQQHIASGAGQQRRGALPPPPPPPPPLPAHQLPQLSAAFQQQSQPSLLPATSSSTHRHQSAQSHHQQQQQQQQQLLQQQPTQKMNMIYSPGLPPPPPLQLFTYQPPAQHHQHQKPPPAYGAAISQIRSQHNQNKQQMALSSHGLPPPAIAGVPANAAPPAAPTAVKHLQQATKQSELPPPPLTAPTGTNATHANPKCSADSAPVAHSFQHQHQHFVFNHFNSATPTSSTATATSSANPKATTTQATSQGTPTIATPNQTTPPTTTGVCQATPPTSAMTTPTATSSLSRQTNSPFAALLSAAVPSPSVLRFAESPVVHYLERDNGDFIVQEPPKHIVECVEKDNGEFSMIERIYQSPPSVLHIHDDDEDDDDDDDDDGDIDDKEDEDSTKSDAASVKSESNGLNVHSNDEEFLRLSQEIGVLSVGNNGNKSKLSENLEVANNQNAVGFEDMEANSNTGTAGAHSVALTSSSSLSSSSNSNSSSNSSASSSSSSSSSSTTRKNTSKNSITVLSDVQLNLNEYLDLVGNIIASSKITGQRGTFSSKAIAPLVKVEKEEPPDDDAVQDLEGDVKEECQSQGITVTTKQTAMPATPGQIGPTTTTATSKSTEPPPNANKNEIEDLLEHNCKNKISVDTKVLKSTSSPLQSPVTCVDDVARDENVGTVAACAVQMTSVIRMVATSQQEALQPKDLVNAAIAKPQNSENSGEGAAAGVGKDEHVAEDLSQPRVPNAVESASKQITLPPVLKKGPKKLVIKPKSKKTEVHSSTNSTSAHATDEQPTTSAKTQPIINENEEEFQALKLEKQKQHLQQLNLSLPQNVVIKSEPYVFENSSSSILEQHLKMGGQPQPSSLKVQCKMEKHSQEMSFSQELTQVVAVTSQMKFEKEQSEVATKLSPSIISENAKDACCLLDFSTAKKHLATSGSVVDNFLSSNSIFSTASGASGITASASTPASLVASSSLHSKMRCDDEFIVPDAGDVQEIVISSNVQDIVISSSYSSQSASDVALNTVSNSNASSTSGSVHQQSQQAPLPPHSSNFNDYPFSFLYGAGNVAQHVSCKGSFSPPYQQTQDATTAATIASGSNSMSPTEDSTSANTPLQHQQQNHFSGAISQWYHQHATTAANSDFDAALAVDCNAAVDTDVGKYLDLDTCKRESIAGVQAAPSSTSSSFTVATESSLAGGCTTDALNIRTDEKMPAKGEISEQESNCDIENSWSQPMYADMSARFFRTSFPGLFTQDNCCNQDEYFTVQDLSASTTTNSKSAKSFDFRLPLEATTSTSAAGSSNANSSQLFQKHDILPSTSTNNKKKRKRSVHEEKGAFKRVQPTATVTSQQLLLHQLEQQSSIQHLQPQHQSPTTSTALLAGPSSAVAISLNGVTTEISVPQPKPRKRSYQCTNCPAKFTKLRDRNSHMILEHNYVRKNRRLICMQPNPYQIPATVTTADMATTSGSTVNSLIQEHSNEIGIEDSKQGIIKLEHVDNFEQTPLPPVAERDINTKAEFIDEKDSVALTPVRKITEAEGVVEEGELDKKPAIEPLVDVTPATKLTALYRMLVSYNMSTLKQNQNLPEMDEKFIETSIFFCYVCHRNFSSVKLYDAHITEHPAECFTCGKKFHRWKNFSLHLKRHLGYKEFGCNVCDKKFVVRSALIEHMRMHTGQTPLKCKICGKNFKRYSNLTQHRKRHGKQIVRRKEYVCHCGEVLPSKARFRWHKETHDAKPKCCPYCCDRFVHANSLSRHIRLAHSDKFDFAEPMKCPMCKQVFAKTSIKAHMATHSVDTQHGCPICSKSFSTKWNLKIHSWVHANRTAKPFKCEHCPKAFVREVDFKNHMNAHKQIKPYTCEYCGCKFIRKYNYMRHRREHHGKKKFTCDLCKKSFHRHYYLIEHRRIHTGERPFQCSICGKSSTTKTNHNKHLKIHHSRDPFTVEA